MADIRTSLENDAAEAAALRDRIIELRGYARSAEARLTTLSFDTVINSLDDLLGDAAFESNWYLNRKEAAE